MKKRFLFMLSIAAMSCLLLSTNAEANVYTQFSGVRSQVYGDYIIPDSLKGNFVTLTDGSNGTVNQFRLYPNPATRPDNNLDDGYAVVPLGFSYRYNGKNYTQVYVSINGFVTFDEPPGNEHIARRTENLFKQSGEIPTNVIAPYWGDHKYHQNDEVNVIRQGWAPSNIGYLQYTYQVNYPVGSTNMVGKKCILIQWDGLNVNWRDSVSAENITYYKGNVASFQLIIYEGPDPLVAQQGAVEFRYGNLGLTPEQEQAKMPGVIVNPNNYASVGIKGNETTSAMQSDFINALYNGTYFPVDEFQQRRSEVLASSWTPSGITTRNIIFLANHTVIGNSDWGDGDADMSKAEGGKHYEQYRDVQNRFVTINDARVIMKSTVTNVPLDPKFGQDAFHGDVNHDGRYFFLTKRHDITNEAAAIERVPRTGAEFNGTDEEYNSAQIMSRDTFKLRKLRDNAGNYGFMPRFGKNDNIIKIDFAPTGRFDVETSIKTFRVVDPGYTYTTVNDYEMLIAAIDTNDRSALWDVSERINLDREEGLIRVSLKKNIDWRNRYIQDSLPPMIVDTTALLWEANELDASVILSYLGAKVTSLPWTLDNPEFNGKNKLGVPYQISNNIRFDNAERNGDVIKVPVYFNGDAENAKSALFTVNTDIINFESANPDVLVDFSNETKKVVIIGDGYFNANTPIAYLTVANNVNELEATNVRFNGTDAENVSLKLNSILNTDANSELLSNSPNPVETNTIIKVNIPEAGNYTLTISDLNGNVVKVIGEGNFNAGTVDFDWNVTNQNGEKVSEGVYMYNLNGEKVSISKKLVVIR